MRKFLSLVLALVMMMSLVTINAGAKEFTDADDITYVEAVDVISTINVMDGYEGGGFSPAGNLTRGAAAKIICNLILGPTTAAELHADTAPYRDVPVNHTFAGYIAYCQKEGIVSGYADGTFRPAGTLTGYAFMKMLLGALGYDAEIEGYVGPNWSINVAKKAIGIGLNKSLVDTFNGVDYITREEAALYAFNTLKADLVEYDQKITATVNGAEVTVGSSNAKPQEWDSQQTRRNNIYDDSIVQFAEQYFNKLVLTQDMDVFGRPDREWKFDGDEIGSYVNYDLFKEEYTAKVTGKDLYELLGSTTVKDYNFEIHIDGEWTKEVLDGYGYFTQGNLVRTNTEKIGNTGNGVLTQVFVDNDKEIVYIAIINTYLAKATADYNEKKDEVTYETWNLTWQGTGKNHLVKAKNNENLTVSGEDFDIKDVKEDDIVLVHVAEGEIKEFVEPEVIDSTTISSFKKESWVNAEGTQYDYASTARYDTEVLDEYDQVNMKDTTYRAFLDEYGYLIGLEIIEEPNQYLFLTGLDTTAYNLGNKRGTANVIFLDGTSDTVTINLAKSKACKTEIANPAGGGNTYIEDNYKVGGTPGSYTAPSDSKPYKDFVQAALWNTWCTYTVDESGVYTVTEVANTPTQMLVNDSSKLWTKRDVDKVGQGHNDMSSGNTAFTIDTKRVGLDGISVPGYQTVYGNDESIYLVASLKKIAEPKGHLRGTNTNTPAVIIDGVDSVITGVRNADLTTWTLAEIDAKTDLTLTGTASSSNQPGNTAYGAYTLFNDDGYVIASVVVGEDNGTTSNYAYAYGDYSKGGAMVKETYNSDTKNWTWEAQAIVNGEDVILTEVGDGLSELKEMEPNEWYEVKYKADGTVKSVQWIASDDDTGATASLPTTAGPSSQHTYSVPGTVDGKPGDYVFCVDAANHGTFSRGTAYPKFVGKIEMVENSNVTNNGKLVLFEDLTTNDTKTYPYTISAKANTLQVTTRTGGVSKGFSVAPSAKVWLFQDDYANVNVDLKEMNTVIDCGEGQSGLKKAITNLNLYDAVTTNNEVPFNGYISAVFENGMATTVIIYEVNANLIDQGTETVNRGQRLDSLSTVTEVNEALEKNDVIIPGNWAPAYDNQNRTLVIPANRTLTIQGSFNAVSQSVSIRGLSTTTSRLVVDDAFVMDHDTSPTVNYRVVAGAVRISNVTGVYPIITADMTIKGNVAGYADSLQIVPTSVAPWDLKIQSVVTVENGNIATTAGAVDIWVDGTLSALNGNVTANVTVTTTTSLHVSGNVNGDVTLKNGAATVGGTINGNVTVTNSTIEAGTIAAGTIAAGTSNVLVLDGGKATIGIVAAKVQMKEEDATQNNELVVQTTISGSITQVTEGDKITVEQAASVTGDAATTLGSKNADDPATTVVIAADKGDGTSGVTDLPVATTASSTAVSDPRYKDAYNAAGVSSQISGKTITITVDKAVMEAVTSKAAINDMFPTSAAGTSGTLYYGIVITAPEVDGAKPDSMTITTAGYTEPDYDAETGVYHEYFTVGTGTVDGETVALTATESEELELAISWKYGTKTVSETYTVNIVVA